MHLLPFLDSVILSEILIWIFGWFWMKVFLIFREGRSPPWAWSGNEQSWGQRLASVRAGKGWGPCGFSLASVQSMPIFVNDTHELAWRQNRRQVRLSSHSCPGRLTVKSLATGSPRIVQSGIGERVQSTWFSSVAFWFRHKSWALIYFTFQMIHAGGGGRRLAVA